MEISDTNMPCLHVDSVVVLFWTFHDMKSINRINKIHEQALRIIRKERTSNFDELLSKKMGE